MIVISAPSGAGKSSFLSKALGEFPQLVDTITYTTRQKRTGEVDGDPYYFVDHDKFQKLVSEDFFVEWAHVYGNCYGTPQDQIDEVIASGQTIIMDVDVQGAETFKRKYPESQSIFILPPSQKELLRRITQRDKKLPEDLDLRMEHAQKEIGLAEKFDFQVINGDFDQAYAEFKKIIEDLLVK